MKLDNVHSATAKRKAVSSTLGTHPEFHKCLFCHEIQGFCDIICGPDESFHLLLDLALEMMSLYFPLVLVADYVSGVTAKHQMIGVTFCFNSWTTFAVLIHIRTV